MISEGVPGIDDTFSLQEGRPIPRLEGRTIR